MRTPERAEGGRGRVLTWPQPPLPGASLAISLGTWSLRRPSGLRGTPGTLFFSGERDYGPPIDLWGAGCIMAEMWTRSPIMQGNTEQHQLALISQLCGSITPEVRDQTG